VSESRLADYLDHNRQTAADACKFVEGMTREAFIADRRTQSAVVMSLVWDTVQRGTTRALGETAPSSVHLTGEGVTPLRRAASRYTASAVTTRGTAASSARVYSACGLPSKLAAGPDSSTRPLRITTTSSAMYSTTPMLCVMKR